MSDTVADVLERAADLIEPEGKWTQGNYALTQRGRSIGPTADNATCWCALGAIRKAGKYVDDHNPAALSFCAFIFAPVGPWNDDPERAQAEVVTKLRGAAALAREQGK